ncbi:MAG: hypothetical protein OXC14_04130 [Rhodospirillaceae bacterium]|nr:hypothetical protein [Rhodospirillaceae bacterium]
MRTIGTVIASIAALALAGCGGGGESRPGPESIRDLTGLASPSETAAAQTARAPAIVSRADSLVMSTMHGETSDARVPTLRVRARCAGTRCDLYELTTGYNASIHLSDLSLTGLPTVAIGTKHGVTLMSWSDSDYTAYGAWMEHSGFAVQTEDGVIEDVRIGVRYGLAGGDLTGTRPTGSATWLGLMVGTPTTGRPRGDRLQGIAALNYDMDAGGLDVGFSSITNVDRGAAHATPVVMFNDLTIASDGTFQAGLTGNRIQGGFYGPGHAEAAGVFEQANIVGAFGAKRQ